MQRIGQQVDLHGVVPQRLENSSAEKCPAVADAVLEVCCQAQNLKDVVAEGFHALFHYPYITPI